VKGEWQLENSLKSKFHGMSTADLKAEAKNTEDAKKVAHLNRQELIDALNKKEGADKPKKTAKGQSIRDIKKDINKLRKVKEIVAMETAELKHMIEKRESHSAQELHLAEQELARREKLGDKFEKLNGHYKRNLARKIKNLKRKTRSIAQSLR
jgi:hypothetical protein